MIHFLWAAEPCSFASINRMYLSYYHQQGKRQSDRRQSEEVRIMPCVLACKLLLTAKEVGYQLDNFSVFCLFPVPYFNFFSFVNSCNTSKCDTKFGYNRQIS